MEGRVGLRGRFPKPGGAGGSGHGVLLRCVSLNPSLTPGAGQTEKLEGHNLISYKYTGGVFAERLTAARGAGPPGPGGVPLAPRDAETLLQRRQRRAQKKKPKRPPGTSPRTLPDIPSSGKVRPTALRTRLLHHPRRCP